MIQSKPKTEWQLDWEKIKPGWYETTDALDTLWRVVQSRSNEWEVIRPQLSTIDFYASTMAEAKLCAEDMSRERLDPEFRIRRDRARAKAAAYRTRRNIRMIHTTQGDHIHEIC